MQVFRAPKDYNERRGVYGFCKIELPKKIATQRIFAASIPDERPGIHRQRDQIKDTDRCELYRFSGHIYIVQRRIPPASIG